MSVKVYFIVRLYRDYCSLVHTERQVNPVRWLQSGDYLSKTFTIGLFCLQTVLTVRGSLQSGIHKSLCCTKSIADLLTNEEKQLFTTLLLYFKFQKKTHRTSELPGLLNECIIKAYLKGYCNTSKLTTIDNSFATHVGFHCWSQSPHMNYHSRVN